MFPKHTRKNGPNPDWGFYNAVSISRKDPVRGKGDDLRRVARIITVFHIAVGSYEPTVSLPILTKWSLTFRALHINACEAWCWYRLLIDWSWHRYRLLLPWQDLWAPVHGGTRNSFGAVLEPEAPSFVSVNINAQSSRAHENRQGFNEQMIQTESQENFQIFRATA